MIVKKTLENTKVFLMITKYELYRRLAIMSEQSTTMNNSVLLLILRLQILRSACVTPFVYTL